MFGVIPLATSELNLDRAQADRLDELLRDAMSQLVSTGRKFIEIGKAEETAKLATADNQELLNDEIDDAE